MRFRTVTVFRDHHKINQFFNGGVLKSSFLNVRNPIGQNSKCVSLAFDFLNQFNSPINKKNIVTQVNTRMRNGRKVKTISQRRDNSKGHKIKPHQGLGFIA